MRFFSLFISLLQRLFPSFLRPDYVSSDTNEFILSSNGGPRDSHENFRLREATRTITASTVMKYVTKTVLGVGVQAKMQFLHQKRYPISSLYTGFNESLSYTSNGTPLHVGISLSEYTERAVCLVIIVMLSTDRNPTWEVIRCKRTALNTNCTSIYFICWKSRACVYIHHIQ